MKDSIEVSFGNHTRTIPKENISFVGGDEGVFASYQEANMIYLLAGDDGFWWHIASYHQDWMAEISSNLYQYAPGKRRK